MTTLRLPLVDDSQPNKRPHHASAADALRDATLARWYTEHHRRVYAICLRILADVESAEDATQEAFVAAWQAWGRFRGESSEATWLHTIAARTAVKRVVAERRRGEERSLDDPRVDARVPDHPLADRVDLEAMIRRLPERARAVFVLHEIHGYRLTEIAAWMGTSVGTVKSQLHRARTILMEKLDR